MRFGLLLCVDYNQYKVLYDFRKFFVKFFNLFFQTVHFYATFYSYMFVTTAVVTYSIVIVCGYKTYSYIKKSECSQKTRILRQKLTIMMCAQVRLLTCLTLSHMRHMLDRVENVLKKNLVLCLCSLSCSYLCTQFF